MYHVHCSSVWSDLLCDTPQNSDCWESTCDDCKDGRKFVPKKSLASECSYKQLGTIVVPVAKKGKLYIIYIIHKRAHLNSVL